MSSGLGLHGNVSRCFYYMQDFTSCMKTSDNIELCRDLRDDYLECLHHRKEYNKVVAIKKHAELAAAREKDTAHGHEHGGGHH